MRDVVLNFIEAINSGDIKKISSFMTPDHVFIDNIGHGHKGSELVKSGWLAYFGYL